MALPTHQDLTESDIDFVAETVRIVATEVRVTQGRRIGPAERQTAPQDGLTKEYSELKHAEHAICR